MAKWKVETKANAQHKTKNLFQTILAENLGSKWRKKNTDKSERYLLNRTFKPKNNIVRKSLPKFSFFVLS